MCNLAKFRKILHNFAKFCENKVLNFSLKISKILFKMLPIFANFCENFAILKENFAKKQ